MKVIRAAGAAILCAIFTANAICTASAHAIDISAEEWAQMKKEVEELRKSRTAPPPAPIMSQVDGVVSKKFGPDAPVSTKQGKLKITGLVQVWYYSIQNDNSALFDDPDINGVPDTNETSDNDGFQVKRTDLRFDIDIHENVSAVVWIDPAREVLSFPSFSSNQGLFKRGRNTNLANVQTGAGAAPRLVQDAYIKYHSMVPHHDFQIGQFRPALGEEGIRLNGQLDFVERSFIGQLTTNRDTGLQVHGTYWEDRFQYWLGVFNGPGNYYLSGGQTQNRSDDNDEKDFQYRVMLRPVWDECKWGKLEMSFASMFGKHGESGAADPVGNAINGLNRNSNWAMRHYAHIYYAPASVVKGLWLRGEYAFIKDRNTTGTVVDLTGIDPNAPATGIGSQTVGNTFSSQGGYAAIGFKFSDSDRCLPEWLKPFEFCARYDQFENIQVTDLVNPAHTDNFKTKIWTAGINYYIKGHNAKLQFNYNVVDEPNGRNAGDTRRFHEVENDNWVVNFQVWF